MSGEYASSWAISALVAGGLAAAAGALTKKPRGPATPPPMPDQTSVLQSQQLQESKDAALQYGRAATVLTGTGTAGASSTGDRLGP